MTPRRVAELLRLAWWTTRLNRRRPLAALAEALDDRSLIEGSGLFDAEWYRACYRDVADAGLDPLDHFTVFAAAQRRNPNSLFDSGWYLAENPDVATRGQNPLVHFLREGAAAGRDPSPLFDAELYRSGEDVPKDLAAAFRHFWASGLRVAPGAYRSAEALLTCQRRYLQRTDTRLERDSRTGQRPFAVYLQCGGGSLHAQWLTGRLRSWDLIVNHYDGAFRRSIPCDVELHQEGVLPGTKFTAMHGLLERWPDLLARYDFVLLLDDDVVIPGQGLERLFHMAADNGLDLAQASLSSDSHSFFEVFRHRGGAALRPVRGVEIMMPLLSRRALRLAGPLFGETISGWGLDYALAEIVARDLGGRVAVVDDVVAQHTRPVDTAGGAYYQMLMREQIYPHVELKQVRHKHGVRWVGFAAP
jgi:hypothetical protein